MARGTSSSGGSSKRISRTGGISADVEEIQDCLGQPTVRVTLRLGDAEGIGVFATGTDLGDDVAQVVAAGAAVANVQRTILPMIRQSDADLRRHEALLELERQVVKEAGNNCGDLGANAVVPVSWALWQLAAALRNITLSEYLHRYEPELASGERTRMFMTLFSGGDHALVEGERRGHDRIDLQEIMVVPVAVSNYREALAVGERIDATLQELLVREHGAERVGRASDGGLTVAGLGDIGTAITRVLEAIERSGHVPGTEVKLAIDAAASRLYDPDASRYRLQGGSLDSSQMTTFWCELADHLGDRLLAVEDGLDSNDWEGWSKLAAALGERGVLALGDDLFMTQLRRLRRGVNNSSAHGVVIKPSQNGSLGGALELVRYARENDVQVVFGHRRGETLDPGIADLAAATGVLGIKAGAPQPESDFPDPVAWVRRAKYLRMIELEETGRR